MKWAVVPFGRLKDAAKIKFENLKACFGLNLSAKDYNDPEGVDASMLSQWKNEPEHKATLKRECEKLSNSIVQVKGPC